MSQADSANITNPSRRELAPLFVGSAVAAGAIAGKVLSNAHLDAGLIELGKKLDEAWAKERAVFAVMPDDYPDEDANAVCDPCGKLVDQILSVSAKTMDGLRVKAQAISWCHSGNYEPEHYSTTDMKLTVSIIKDLLSF